MTNQIKINNITQGKAKSWTSEAKHKHIKKLANMNVPQEYKASYKKTSSETL